MRRGGANTDQVIIGRLGYPLIRLDMSSADLSRGRKKVATMQFVFKYKAGW
jgi:hypothetical protein